MKSTVQKKMLTAARRAADKAYAPYSGFRVGAAVVDDQDRIYSAGNVENSSYGLTLCAERNAVARAVSAGARRIEAVLVYANTEKLTPPCGACLQTIAEFGEDPEIVLANWKRTKALRLQDCLPHRFSL